MERGKRMAECIDEINECLKNAADLEMTFNRRATAIIDFVQLPNEVINDIVGVVAREEAPGYEPSAHELLIELDGPWGDFAASTKSPESVALRLLGKITSTTRIDQKEEKKELSLEEAKNRYINDCRIDEKTDFSLIRQLASNLYESIGFYRASSVPSDVFAMLGDRFTHVSWYDGGHTINADAMRFLKRQLRSKHLRSFNTDVLELEELLVDFVKKPTFESLECMNSPKFIMDADRAWEARESFQMARQRISTKFNAKAVKEVLKHFKITRNRRNVIEEAETHSIHKTATKKVTVRWSTSNSIYFTLDFHN